LNRSAVPALGNKGFSPLTPFLVGFDLAARHFRPRKPHVLVACMPKSGSTFLTNTLAAHAGLRRCALLPTYGDREQELCELKLTRYNGRGFVAQQHVRNSAWTQELARRYGLTVVVLVRDLFDCVVSIRDHIRKEGDFGALIRLTPRHLALADAELDELIVQLAMPWYLSFYASWRADPRALFVHYEDMVADPASILEEVLAQAGVETSPARIAEALGRSAGQQSRFNRGVCGRGKTLRPETRRRLTELMAVYPEFADDRLFRAAYARPVLVVDQTRSPAAAAVAG
jgi:hypothetical protein